MPSVEAGRCEIALSEITLDVYMTMTTMEHDGILSQVRRVQSKEKQLISQLFMLHIVQRWDYIFDLPLTTNNCTGWRKCFRNSLLKF